MPNKFLRWSVWRANLNPVVGSEQGLTRPVIIISEDSVNEAINTVTALPITSKKDYRVIYPNEVYIPARACGLSLDSIILCHQIRTIDKKRLAQYYGTVEEEMYRSEIRDALLFHLGFESNELDS